MQADGIELERPFLDRTEAGRVLAAQVRARYQGHAGLVVLGLARGGLPVAVEVARSLAAPLGVMIVRKLGVPGQEELAMGAIASGGILVRNRDVLAGVADAEHELARVAARELIELQRREREYLGVTPAIDVFKRTVILVDDGMATGATMQAAVEAVRRRGAAQVIVAVPHASPQACEDVRNLANDCICSMTPEPYYAVGAWYQKFPQVTDAEVRAILGTQAEGVPRRRAR